jgi:hypothetical protein
MVDTVTSQNIDVFPSWYTLYSLDSKSHEYDTESLSLRQVPEMNPDLLKAGEYVPAD